MKRNRENNKDFIKDGYNTNDLLSIINEIRTKYEIVKLKEAYKETDEKYKEIEKNYKFFKDRYPFLFDMVLKPDMDMNRFKYMINLREDIVNNKTTSEKASIKVGKDLYKDFMEK
tara:strand:- start:143 stop:487 length:345 start_codon:yes stop_codon:yes gene_type:complete